MSGNIAKGDRVCWRSYVDKTKIICGNVGEVDKYGYILVKFIDSCGVPIIGLVEFQETIRLISRKAMISK